MKLVRKAKTMDFWAEEKHLISVSWNPILRIILIGLDMNRTI